jgi:tetratricopeptide (TPR) repeat protein
MKRFLYWAGATLGFLLGLCTKENVAILPLFVALYELYFFQSLDLGPRGRRSLAYSLGLALLSGLVMSLLLGNRLVGIITEGYKLWDFSLTERVLTQFRVVLYYATLLVYPAPSRLNLDYDFPTSHGILDPPTTLLSILIVCGLIGYSFWSARKRPLFSYFVLWYFGNLVIESSIFPLEMVYEHRLYLPAIGPFVLFTVFVVSGWEKIRGGMRQGSELGVRSSEQEAATPLTKKANLTRARITGLMRKDCPLWGALIGLSVLLAGGSYDRNKIWKDPITLWGDCVKKSPNKARPHAALGYYLVRAKQYDGGIEEMQTALRLNPKAVDYVHYNLGETYAELKQNDKALAHFEEYARTHPGDPRVYNDIGLIKLERKETKEAVQLFKRGLDLKPYLRNLHADLRVNLGNAYLQMNQPDQAQSEFRQALGLRPDLFQIYAKMGSNAEAIESYKRLIQLKPDDPDGYNNLGTLYNAKGSYAEAIKAFEKAIQIRPDFPVALSNLGAAYSRAGRYQEAIDVLKKAEQLSPKDAEIINNLGVAYRKAGQYQGAIGAYGRALRLNPGEPEIHCNLGDAYYHLGRFREAIEGYRRAIERNPKVELYHFNLGVAHGSLGDHRAATEAYQEALRINPNYAQARFNLGLSYLMLKRRELALQEYEVLKNADKSRADKLLSLIKSAQ